jgi:hypothetical protein
LRKKYEKSGKKKRRKKINGEKWNKQDYFISLTCVWVINLTMLIGEYKQEEFKTAFNKITSIFLHYTNVSIANIFSPFTSMKARNFQNGA